MSEEDRSRLYDWFCEHLDQPIAEYVMSCLAPAPLSDLVTKQHLETVLAAEFAAFALKMAAQRDADRKEAAAQREADREEAAAQREADRKEAAAQREADRTDLAAQREADRTDLAALREADRNSAAAQREADRREIRHQFRWLVGIGLTILGVLVALPGVMAAFGAFS